MFQQAHRAVAHLRVIEGAVQSDSIIEWVRLTATRITQIIKRAGLRPHPSVAYWSSWSRKCQPEANTSSKPCATHHLAKELAGGLDATPGRDVFALNNRRPWRRKLLDEALVRDDTSIEVDLCEGCQYSVYLVDARGFLAPDRASLTYGSHRARRRRRQSWRCSPRA